MTRTGQGWWKSAAVAAAALLVPACGGPGDGGAIAEQRAPILSGASTSDPVGYAYVAEPAAFCSGTMLTPRWVLTAGHCLINNDTGAYFNPPTGVVYLGTSSTNIRNNAQGFVHPQWWNPTLPAGQQFPKDIAHDVALLHLPTPYSPAGYSNGLINTLSNRAPYANEILNCYGYGYTNTAQTAGGAIGGLETAQLWLTNPNTWLTGLQLVSDYNSSQSAPMLGLATNDQGQQLYHGDSGGSCSASAVVPTQIVGVNEGVLTDNSTSVLVPVGGVQAWVDATMHGPTSSLGLPPGGASPFTTAVSAPTSNGTSLYVVAAYKGSGGNKLYMRAYTDSTGWSSWSALSMSGLPSSGINSRVAVAASSFSPGFAQVVFTVLGADQQMYYTTLAPGSGPGPAWTSLNWVLVGGGFPAGTHPAIATYGNRVDVFGIGTDWRIYTKWKSDLSTSVAFSGWSQVSSSMTFAKGMSVAALGNAYYLLALSDGTTTTPNGGNAAWLTYLGNVSPTNYGIWHSWSSLGGGFLSPPAIAQWGGGLAIYGIGTDSTLYRSSHNIVDAFNLWSPWYRVASGPFNQPEGVSANTSSSFASQINIVSRDSGGNPVQIVYGW